MSSYDGFEAGFDYVVRALVRSGLEYEPIGWNLIVWRGTARDEWCHVMVYRDRARVYKDFRGSVGGVVIDRSVYYHDPGFVGTLAGLIRSVVC